MILLESECIERGLTSACDALWRKATALTKQKGLRPVFLQDFDLIGRAEATAIFAMPGTVRSQGPGPEHDRIGRLQDFHRWDRRG